MKRLDFYYFLSVFILALFLYGFPSFKHLASARDYATHPTKEQRTSHMLQFFDDKGKETGQCSGTAIGPHAFMTAEHCVEGREKQVRFDLSVEMHNLVAATSDGRDHLIFLVDGTAFVNIEEVRQTVAKLGDNVVLYGDGQESYPPVPKYGTLSNCYDPSDVDEASGVFCSSTQVIPGDSGAAIYNSKGEIVGLLTYGAGDGTSVGFALNFTAEQLNTAKTFDGKIPEPDLNTLIQQMLGDAPKE